MNIWTPRLTILLFPITSPKPDLWLLLEFQLLWVLLPTNIPEFVLMELTSILLKVMLLSCGNWITSYAWAVGPVTSLSTIGVSIKSLSVNSVRLAVNRFPAPATLLIELVFLLSASQLEAALSPTKTAAPVLMLFTAMQLKIIRSGIWTPLSYGEYFSHIYYADVSACATAMGRTTLCPAEYNEAVLFC